MIYHFFFKKRLTVWCIALVIWLPDAFLCCDPVWAEGCGLPRRCKRLWHPRDLHRRLEPGRVSCAVCNAEKKTARSSRASRTWCTFPLLQCPHNVHKLDGYMCDSSQVSAGLRRGFKCATHSDTCLIAVVSTGPLLRWAMQDSWRTV